MLSDLNILDRLQAESDALPSHREEVLQHLIELGYLPLHCADYCSEKQLAEAKSSFLLELENSEFGAALKREHFDVVQLLRMATDIDEGWLFSNLPKSGEITLASRIFHYRLDIMGVWPFKIGQAFGRQSIFQLDLININFHQEPLQIINLLADFESFTSLFLKQSSLEHLLIFIDVPDATDKQIRKSDSEGAFKRQMSRDFSDDLFFNQLKMNVFDEKQKNINLNWLKELSLRPINQFLIRLIQVHQWKDGHYDGLLDSNMGPVTLGSLINAVKLDALMDDDREKLRKVLFHVKDGVFIFNAYEFLVKYQLEKSTDRSAATWNELIVGIQNLPDKKQQQFEENFKTIEKELAEPVKEKNGLLKRVYYGAKSLLIKLASKISKIIGWVVQKAKHAWGMLKQLFRGFFADLKLAIKSLMQGFAFLFGNKTIVTSSGNATAISKFSIDGDNANLLLNMSSECLGSHLSNVNHQVKAMAFSNAVLSAFLAIIIKSINVITWPIVLFTIVDSFKNIQQKFNALQTKTTI